MIKAKQDREAMAQAGKILYRILHEIKQKALPGTSTAELNALAEALMAEHHVVSSFKNYPGKKCAFPASLCTSLNEEIVHGIPKKETILKQGDILSLDLGIWYTPTTGKKVCVDSAITLGVGDISEVAKKLIHTAEHALAIGISCVKDGNFINQIAKAIQTYVESQGFAIVRNLVGHGVGYRVHEPPAVPNFLESSKNSHSGQKLKAGMTIAIEPMITEKSFRTVQKPDGWTISTRDKSLSAHFEHTVAVLKNGCKILTLDT